MSQPMTKPLSMPSPVDLRQRMIEDMNVRGFSAKTQHDYLRIVASPSPWA